MPIGMDGALRIVREALEADNTNVNRIIVLASDAKVPDRTLDGDVVAILRPDSTSREIVELPGGHRGGSAVYTVAHAIEVTLLVDPSAVDFHARVERVADRITLANVDAAEQHELLYVTVSETVFERNADIFENRRAVTMTVQVGEHKTGGLS